MANLAAMGSYSGKSESESDSIESSCPESDATTASSSPESTRIRFLAGLRDLVPSLTWSLPGKCLLISDSTTPLAEETKSESCPSASN